MKFLRGIDFLFNKKKLILSFFLALCLLKLPAQEIQRCASQTLYNYKLNNGLIKPSIKRLLKTGGQNPTITGIITIPVVVHIIHNQKDGLVGGSNNSNISDEQIESQIKVLNEDYRRMQNTNGSNTNPDGADVEIQFVLAKTDTNCNPTTGITRHYNDKGGYDFFADEYLIKSFDHWPHDQYLNIWVISVTGGFLGLTQFPNYSGLPGLYENNGDNFTDGILVSHKAFGSRTGTSSSGIYSYGRTLTHEIGHWLGLIHTWGDDFCGDDFCDDTPFATGSNLGKDCKDIYSNCAGIATRNMIENYLDYSPDICMNIFTKDQKNRMRYAIQNAPERKKLLSSQGANTTLSYALPLYRTFEDTEEASIVAPWVQLNSVFNFYNSNAGEGSYGKSEYSLVAKNNITNVGLSASIISPIIDLNKYDYPVLTFDLAYPTEEKTDSLIIEVYTGCKTSPLTFVKYEGSSLITTSNKSNSFIPAAHDWKTKYLDLSVLKEVSSQKISFIKIQFENHSAGINNLYLDNIRVFNSNKSLKVAAFGNPYKLNTSTKFNENDRSIMLEALFNGPADISFEIYDITGKKMYAKSSAQALPGIFYINSGNFASGVYLVKTVVNAQVNTNKIVIF